MTDLGVFETIWLVDFEFRQPHGERPEPVCMVAVEYRSKRLLRLWKDEIHGLRRPPYELGPKALFVAYYASAELGCHIALGWPMPSRILDLYAEFRCLTSGVSVPCGSGLLGALACFGLGAIEATEKTSMREDAGLALEDETGEDKPRIEIKIERPEDRVNDFREVETGFTEEQALLEAVRCLRCDLEKA